MKYEKGESEIYTAPNKRRILKCSKAVLIRKFTQMAIALLAIIVKARPKDIYIFALMLNRLHEKVSVATSPSVSDSMQIRSPTHCTRPNKPRGHPRSPPEHPGQPRNSHTDNTEKRQRTPKPIQPQIQQRIKSIYQFNSI